jgi:hypothetical protein
VSTAASPVSPSGPGGSAPAPASEPCPLCGAPLRSDQEWCLKCGAAARTRLATSPNWKAPLITVAVVCALALGVLVAALVSLAGDSGPAPAPKTMTVTSSQPVAGTAPTSTPGATTSTATVTQPATSTPTAPATAPKATTPNNGATRTTPNRRPQGQ